MYRSFTFMLLLAAVSTTTYAAEYTYLENFDTTALNQIPDGWQIAATNPSGALADWQIAVENPANPRQRILTLSKIHDPSSGVFNLCWTNRVRFQNGDLSVRVRANDGNNDQGGGIIWRVKDANNYYLARYNPLENNFRLYHVINGHRSQLASAEKLKVVTGEWFKIRIAHHGQRIQGWLNNQPAWDVSDNRLPAAGGVGVWTKADATSSFDDVTVTATSKSNSGVTD